MVSEEYLTQRVRDHLMETIPLTLREVPFLNRMIDLVGYDPTSDQITMVEVKVKNWQVALKQARSCLLGADNVYIALPDEFVHRVDAEALQGDGIGLLSIGKDIVCIIHPRQSEYKHEFHSTWLRNTINILKENEKQKGKDERE